MAILEMKHVSKYFGKVAANVDVNLSVEQGEVHALLGENGAGKSTLMNILYGLYEQSSGHIYLNGERLKLRNPKDAINKGIGMVHQHFMLVPTLTVIENVVLGMDSNHAILDLKKSAEEFTEMAKNYDMPIDPWAKVSSLSVGQQQRAEILKALYRKASILILDEPTAVLTPQEATALFDVIRRLTAEKLTIILISHKMNEIMAVCNRCTVLRQGRVVATMPVSEIQDASQLAELMVGQQVKLTMDKKPSTPGPCVLKVQNISYKDKHKVSRLNKVSFQIRAGEIVGICGVDGNGQSELVRCITGLIHPGEGQILLGAEDISKEHTSEILKKGVSHIPEDRHKMGMIMDMSINENLILMSFHQKPYSKNKLLNWKWIRSHNEDIVETYNVKTPDIYERAGNLSGGNQQKFVVGRELDRKPTLLVAMHPARGLDIGATKFIQQRLLEESERGAAVLLVSTELDEIMELSDRIVVMNSGNVVGIVNQAEATRERLGLMMASEV
ncbi:MAG: heme transporter ATP-binding protein [Lachnospiraceae bacterium]|jgi:simple sugar transport system ATP-binding protein|nr:heme transporter ATP-binding protein [Lachnospiraceae bacterium]